MPPSTPENDPAPVIQKIDTLFEQAGLQRNLRGKTGVTARMRLKRSTQQELIPPAPIPLLAPNGVQWLAVPAWEKMNWLWHGFSTRRGGLSRVYCADNAQGDLNLGFTEEDDRDTVARNRRLFAQAISGDPSTPVVDLRQIHSNLVRLVTAADASRKQPFKAGVPSDTGSPASDFCSLGWGDRSSSLGWKADGLMTDEPGLLLGIRTADCIPILVADRKRRAVAAFHAGWRGTVKRIVESGVGRMRLQFGSRPEDLIAAIGPGIGPCCYAVGEEVLSAFESQFAYARELFCEVYDSDPVRTKYPLIFMTQRAPGHSEIGPRLHLNLVEANRRQLLSAGLKPRAIHVVGGCTSCHRELFFSHRGSEGHAGRMMSVIGIRPDAARR
jgi:YfiH family protein